MSLAFFETPSMCEPSDRDRLGPATSAWVDEHHSARSGAQPADERDRMLVPFFGSITVLRALIGAEAMATLLHGEYAATARMAERDRLERACAMARRS